MCLLSILCVDISVIFFGLTMMDVSQSTRNMACSVWVQLALNGVTGILAAIMTRTWAIFKVFVNPKMRAINISDNQKMARWVGILLPSVVLLIVWEVAYGSRSKPPTELEASYTCDTDGMILIILWCVYVAMIFGYLSYLCWRVRKSPAEFNEVFNLFLNFICILVAMILIIPVFLEAKAPSPKLLGQGVIAFWSCWCSLMFLFFPKVGAILFSKEERSNIKGSSAAAQNGRRVTKQRAGLTPF